MLGTTYRWRASNTQNQSITVTLKAKLWKFSSAGALVYSAEQSLITAAALAATTGTSASTTVDNSTDLYIGADLTLSCTAAVATSGSGVVLVTLERSTDAGTTWASAGLGELVGGYAVTVADATAARLKNIAVN